MNNLSSSAYTGRAPRTMSAAFGPYITSNALQPLPTPIDWQDRVVVIGCAVVGVIFLVLAVSGVLA